MRELAVDWQVVLGRVEETKGEVEKVGEGVGPLDGCGPLNAVEILKNLCDCLEELLELCQSDRCSLLCEWTWALT